MKKIIYHIYSIIGNALWLIAIVMLFDAYGKNDTTITISIVILIEYCIESNREIVKSKLLNKDK